MVFLLLRFSFENLLKFYLSTINSITLLINRMNLFMTDEFIIIACDGLCEVLIPLQRVIDIEYDRCF